MRACQMTDSKTLVTIPVFNGEDFIERSIMSCINQTVRIEVWVIDNCSDDTTQLKVKKLSEEYPQVKLIVNDNNLGRVGNWNECLTRFENSDFEYLKMLFVGDTLLPNCIATVDNIFNTQCGLAMVAWPYIFVDDIKNKQRIPRLLNENVRLSKKELVERGMYPSQFAGAIICHTFAKHAIYGERFCEHYLGMAEFTNKVPLKGDYYHFNEPLSEFHLDGHSSYPKQFEYLFVLERAYTKALSLERAKEWITPKAHDDIKAQILVQLNNDFK